MVDIREGRPVYLKDQVVARVGQGFNQIPQQGLPEINVPLERGIAIPRYDLMGSTEELFTRDGVRFDPAIVILRPDGLESSGPVEGRIRIWDRPSAVRNEIEWELGVYTLYPDNQDSLRYMPPLRRQSLLGDAPYFDLADRSMSGYYANFPYRAIILGNSKIGVDGVLIVDNPDGFGTYHLIAPVKLPANFRDAVNENGRFKKTDAEKGFDALAAKIKRLSPYVGAVLYEAGARKAEIRVGQREISCVVISGQSFFRLVLNASAESAQQLLRRLQDGSLGREHPLSVYRPKELRGTGLTVVLEWGLEEGRLNPQAWLIGVDKVSLKPQDGARVAVANENAGAILDSIAFPQEIKLPPRRWEIQRMEGRSLLAASRGLGKEGDVKVKSLDEEFEYLRQTVRRGREEEAEYQVDGTVGGYGKKQEIPETPLIPRQPGENKVYAKSQPRYSETKQQRLRRRAAERAARKNKSKRNNSGR